MMCMAVTVMACMSVNAQATSGSCGENATWSYAGTTLTISGTGAMADYTDALTDNPWNEYRASITKVVIGNSITHIGNWAFMGCSSLAEVTIGDHVESIGTEAFANCLNEDFTSIVIPASVENIGAFALSNISHLQYIACYASTAPIVGAEALTLLNNLVAIYVPTAKVGDYQAATGWSDFSAKITYPHGNCGDSEGDPTNAVTWVFDLASGTMTLTGTGAIKTFSDQNPMAYPWNSDEAAVWNPTGMDGDAWGWLSITSLVIGEGITNVPDYSFGMHIHLTSVSLPSTLTTIGASSLEECAFTSITLPEGLTTIGNYAFLASKFSSLTLPSALTTIGGSAFNDCESLTAITIPANVTSIGESAFQNCIALETVTMLRETPPTLGNLAFYDYNDIIIPALTAINVPAASVDDYKAADGWSDYAALIVAGGAPVATTTTFTYTASEQLTVFDNTTYFTGATAVKSHEFAAGTGTVVYDGTVTAIAARTFYYSSAAQTKMTAITIPASVETIGTWAFAQCGALATVTFEGTSSLTTIESYAFGECKNLTAITLPESLTTLGDVMEMGGNTYYSGSVFSEAGLTSIEIPKNLTTVYGGGHFADCPLTSLTVNAANTKFDSRDGCNAVVETATNKIVMGCVATTVPSGIETIGYEAFFGESQTFSLVLPASVTTIEDRAFHWADGLKTITIPMGVTAITEETFLSAEGVTDVYCYASPTITWEGLNQAFKYGTKSVNIHVSASDLSTWEANFPDANAFFVGDLGTVAGNDVEGVYWATYYNSAANMKADANTTVYKAAVNGSSLTLTEIDDKVINAGEAVILKSTGANVSMITQAAASVDDYSGNALEGVNVATAPAGGYKYYVLSNEGSTLGFYHYTGATLGANKAFIKVADAGGAPAFYAFDFSGEATGINTLNVKRGTWNGEVYNLAGQRVAQPTKGLYIVNGKKVVIK